jgi:hypothetical protein
MRGPIAKKCRAILSLHAADVDEPQLYLVDECRGLKHVVRRLAGHVASGQASQLVVHEGTSLSTAPSSPPRQSMKTAVTSCAGIAGP